MKRLIDISLASVVICFLLIPLVLIALIVKLTSPGPALHYSERIGRYNEPFIFPKFRTMHADTPLVATNELENPNVHITKIGHFLRRSSLDELPQLFCVLSGKMSLVGPRPVIASQTSLVKKRQDAGIHNLRPGITGWAQINGRDNLEEDAKVKLELEYLEKQSIIFDIVIIWRTFFYVLNSEGIRH